MISIVLISLLYVPFLNTKNVLLIITEKYVIFDSQLSVQSVFIYFVSINKNIY
jgi:hypothetical protein